MQGLLSVTRSNSNLADHFLQTQGHPPMATALPNFLKARGRGGSDELVTKSDNGGRGILTDGDVTTKKNCVLHFAIIPFTSGSFLSL